MQNHINYMDTVIIIGAGLAGLTAADQILRNSPDSSVLVLEAMSEPGGRTRSKKINGAFFDFGGQWFGPPQKYINQLAIRSKSEKFPQPDKGKRIMQLGTQISTYDTSIPANFGFLPTLQMNFIIWKIGKMAKTVPLENPKDCPNAIQWDSKTAAAWINENIWYEKIKKLFLLSVTSICGCESNEVSFLFFLWYVHHNHGFENLMVTEGGLQQSKFVKGSQSLSFFLADEIIKRGGEIRYNSFVESIKQTADGVFVRTRKGQEFTGSYLVMANPPTASRSIHFEPQLSRQRRFIRDRYVMGAYSKMIIFYEKQYWKQKGFSGEIISDCIETPIMWAYDQTRPKQNGQVQPAILILFAGYVDEIFNKNPSQINSIKKSVVQKLASYYGCQQMLAPQSVQVLVWNFEKSVEGAPCAFTPPGVLTRMGDIRKPEGRVHWAGTETARISQGYMDGAIESGIRVSKQILDRLKGTEIRTSSARNKWNSLIFGYKQSNWFKKIIFW